MQKFSLVIIFSILTAGSLARSIDSSNTEELPVAVVFVRDDSENVQLIRQKRQFNNFGGFGPQNYGQSSALANANANNHYSGPNGFGASNALAGAQSFQSQGPLGGFGASAANSGSQGFSAGPGGIQGNAGFSGSQSYNLPNGKTLALSYGSGYNVAPGQAPQISNSNSLAYT